MAAFGPRDAPEAVYMLPRGTCCSRASGAQVFEWQRLQNEWQVKQKEGREWGGGFPPEALS